MTAQIVDFLVVGGGPAGLAAALRAKELGLVTLVLDVDDLMRRIRDYSKDKLILPDFGGGDRMTFPTGGEWIEKLAFQAIDKDELCRHFKALCQDAEIPVRVGFELTGLEDRPDGTFLVTAFDHRERREVSYAARHVALALGRGVPRRFDIPGNTAAISLRLDDAKRFLGAPACVIGGGTSAAEAVIALSQAKAEARDATTVHWSYRGDKLPRVSKALAETFFEAYAGNGNIRYHPHSEPLMICQSEDRKPQLALRVDRRSIEGRAVEATLLEFPVESCIACIGEDVPESFLLSLGIRMASGGPKNRKRMVVRPCLETQRSRVYLIGDILSQAYFETDDFEADPADFREVRHRGNIKAALRDGVLVAQVVRQKLDGIADAALDLNVGNAPPPPPSPVDELSAKIAVSRPAPAAAKAAAGDDALAWLVRIFGSGAESEEHPLRRGSMVSLGREGCDLSYPDDAVMSAQHASLVVGDDGIVLRDDGSENGVFLQLPSQRKMRLEAGDLLRAGRQFLLVEQAPGGAGAPYVLVHYDAQGQERHRFEVGGGPLILGRESLDPSDSTLSRRQLALTLESQKLLIKDLLSANGSFLRVKDSVHLEPGDRFLAGQQQFAVASRPDEVLDQGNRTVRAKPASTAAATGAPATAGSAQSVESAAQFRTGSPESASPAATPAATPAAQLDGPSVTFKPLGLTFAVKPGQTLLEVAEANGVAITAECHAGICGSDPLRILSGHENLASPPDAGETETLEDLCGLDAGPCRLACKARVKGPVVVEILDR